MSERRSDLGSAALRLTALALGVCLLALVSILFTRDHGRVAAIWPANALALAVLLRTPPRMWPAYLLAATGGYVAANLAAGGESLWPALAFAGCNAVEILLAALLCRQSIGADVDVTRPRQLLTLGAAAAVAPLASAFGALTILGADSELFVRWYLADALGLILVTPALLALAGDFRSLRTIAQRPEVLAPLLALAASMAVVFGQSDYPLLFLVFPPLIWCAFTFSAAGMAATLLGTTVLAVYATLSGYGLVAHIEGGLLAKLTVLQVLLACITLVTLPLTAVLAERRRLNASLREALARMSDSEARYRTLADNATDVIATFDPQTRFTFLSPSVQAVLGYSPEELIGRSTRDIMHPEDYQRSLEAYRQQMGNDGDGSFHFEYRALRKDGTTVWLSGHPRALHDPETGELTGFIDVVRDVTERRAAAEALAASEARYRILTDNASDIVLKFDPHGLILYASPSARRLGYEPEALVGLSCFDLVHPEDAADVGERVRSMIESGVVDPTRARIYRVLTADGGYVWVEGNPTIVRDADGQVTAAVAHIRNISAHKAAEDALAQSEARYRMLAENASDLVIKIDAQGIVEYVSPSIRRLGYEPEELVGGSPLSFVHPDDVQAVTARMRERRRTGEVNFGPDQTYRILKKGGGHVWVESNPSVIRGPDGSVASVISQLRDITTRKADESALAESEARYRMLADHATDVVIKVDAEDTILYVSPSVRRYGYEPEDMIGVSGYTLVHPDDVPTLRSLIADLFRTGQVDPARDRTYRLRTTAGDYVWMEGSPSLVRNDAGEVEAVISQLRDVSLRMELEAELRAARDDAQAAAATKAEFMANMSHEIRTPLTAVLGFTSLLAARDDLADDARAKVDRIAAAGQAMLAIVNDILDFSKLEAGLMPVTPRPANPLEVLENALSLFEPQAAAKGLSLAFEAEALPPHVTLDPDRVRQVLLNLIGNAVKFTDAGTVEVRAAYDPARGRLKVAVRDSGAGMTEEQQAKLFQRFSQVEGEAARAGGGTGLGLAISRGLVEAMGGEIGLTSALGQGSTFTFEIPAPECEAAETATEASPLAGVAGLRVLLADDNATNRELTRAVMEQFEIEVTDASDGAEAVQQAGLLPYDVILLDIRMPVMDGPSAARLIRSEPGPNQTTPILAFSADHELDPAAAGLFDGHVRKPIEVGPLLGALAEATAWEDAVFGEAADRDGACGAR